MEVFSTKFNGYYVSKDGKVWAEFNRYTGKKDVLREVNQHPRGGAKEKDRYMSVNISIKDENGKSTLFQTATFRPKGLLGRLYWFAVLPFHHFIFNGMLTRLIRFRNT